MELICDRSGFYEQPQNSNLANPAQWLIDVLTDGRESDTGISVNWRNSLGLSTAWYCVNTIAGDIAQLPLNCYERKADRTSEEDYTHPGGKILRNPEGPVSGFQFRYLLQNHALTVGNGRAFIVRSGRQEPAAFVPLPAERTTTVSIFSAETSVREKWHVVFPEKGGSPIPLPDRDVFHIFRFSWDGYNGVGPVDLLKNSFGLGIAGDKFTAKFFKHGGTPSFILQAPSTATYFRDPIKAQQFLDDFNKYHAGLDNAQRVGLLREGVEAKVLGVSNRDAQMSELRDFQARDIMRVFGVPTVPGIQNAQAGYNGLEQLNRAYLVHALRPWQKIWEEEAARKLLTDKERKAETYYFMFDSWELVKPLASEEANMLTQYVNGMILERNEAREVIGYAPHKDGSGLINPATTSSQPASDKPANPDNKPKPEPDPTANNRQLIANRLKPLVNAEIRRVRQVAEKSAKWGTSFMDWVDQFYSKHQEKMCAAIVEVGGEDWLGCEYAALSKDQLLNAASGCPKAELPARIEQVIAAWPERTNELAANICEVME